MWDKPHAIAAVRTPNILVQFMASVKTYPRMVLSTPGTSVYRLAYKHDLVLRAVPRKTPPGVYFNRGHALVINAILGRLCSPLAPVEIKLPSQHPEAND